MHKLLSGFLYIFLVYISDIAYSAEAVTSELQVKIALKAEEGVNLQQIVVALVPESYASNQKNPKEIVQSNAQFLPFITIAQTGSIVKFPNKDEFAHHVYSFSRAMSFELPLFGHDEEQEIILENAGIIPIGCNIHDWMLGYIIAVDTPYFTFLDTDKAAVFKDIPTGKYQIAIWHPSMQSFWKQPVSISELDSQLAITLPTTLSPINPLPTPDLDAFELEDY